MFDVAGRRVAALLHGFREAGRQEVSWDGRDAGGAPVGSGIYFVRMLAPDGTKVARLSVAR